MADVLLRPLVNISTSLTTVYIIEKHVRHTPRPQSSHRALFHVEHLTPLPRPVGLLSPEQDHQERDVSGVYPADSAGLAQCLGLDGLELLAGFDAQAVGF